MSITLKNRLSFIVLGSLVTNAALVHTAVAHDFKDRWSVIPKANAAEPATPETPQQPPGDQQSPNDDGHPSAPRSAGPASTPKSAGTATERVLTGRASFYSYRGGKTASGETFRRNALTAASRTLPFGTRLRVTDIKTNRSVEVTVTDRGPASRGLILDLSLGAARELGIEDRGIVQVRAEIIGS